MTKDLDDNLAFFAPSRKTWTIILLMAILNYKYFNLSETKLYTRISCDEDDDDAGEVARAEDPSNLVFSRDISRDVPLHCSSISLFARLTRATSEL